MKKLLSLNYFQNKSLKIFFAFRKLKSLYLSGCSTDSAARISPAKCITKLKLLDLIKFATFSLSEISNTSSYTSFGKSSLFSVIKLSIHVIS